MAIVRSLKPSQNSARPHPTAVDCEWQIVESGDGRLLQLSTYGSDQRASQPKVSQTIQIDESVARELLKIISQAFGNQDERI